MGIIKPWVKIQDEFCLLEARNFQWMQFINFVDTSRKKSINEENTKLITLSIYDH